MTSLWVDHSFDMGMPVPESVGFSSHLLFAFNILFILMEEANLIFKTTVMNAEELVLKKYANEFIFNEMDFL